MSRGMFEGFEMRERHRQILMKQRPYLLHNMCVTEQLWATLMANELLSPDMVEEIKTGLTSNEKVSKMLDMIPQRGPDAFDLFCEALLECDHAHVAEYLKTLEATDQFASEIRPHCVDVSDNLTEKFVKIFQKSTPSVQRFAERKFQIIMEEQDRDLTAKEKEIQDKDSEIMFLQLEVSQLRGHLNTCFETSDNIVQELSNKHVSKIFVKEECEHLQNLQQQLKDIKEFEKIRNFYGNTITLLNFLAKAREAKPSEETTRPSVSRAMSTRGKTMQDRMNMLIEQVQNDAQRFGSKANVPGIMVKAELENLLKTVKDVVFDVHQVREVFKNTMRQKRKMEGEVLSMLHNFQEIRRLEREVKEKQTHITELGKQSNYMRKKIVTKQHRKQIEQIGQTIEQKKMQIRDIQKSLERHISSADQRLHALLNLLPDLEDSGHEYLRSDTEMTSDLESHAGSRLGTPLGTVRPTSAIFNKNTYRKLAETLGKRDPLNNGIHNDADSSTSDSEEETITKKSNNSSNEKKIKEATPSNPKSEPKVPQPPKNHRNANLSQGLKPQSNRPRRNDTSPSRTKSNQVNPKLVTGLSAEDIDKWVAQEKANNEKKRASVQRQPLTLSTPKLVEAEKSFHRAPTMLTIAEANSERDGNTNSPLNALSAAQSKSIPAQSPKRRSVDFGTKLSSKEQYKLNKQRQSLTDFEYEKGYFETKNSSASSSAQRSTDLENNVTDKALTPSISNPGSHNQSKSSLDKTTPTRERLKSLSKDNFNMDVEAEGSLTARKRKQSLLSPTDVNSSVNFMEEQTSELNVAPGRGLKSSRGSSYKDNDINRLKVNASHSREVLKAKTCNLMI